MILGIGIDLVSVARIQELLLKFGTKFESKIFTGREIDRARIIEGQVIKELKGNNFAKALFYAKRFAAKEAFSKAVGFGIGKNIGFLDIEVGNDQFGRPSLTITKEKLDFFQNYFQAPSININLSLSDEFWIAGQSTNQSPNKIYLAQAMVIISK